MSAATPLPRQGDVFFDSRGADRALRLSRHPDAGVIVLSIWNGGVCQGTFRLPVDQIPALADALLSAAPGTRPPFPQTGQYEPPSPERYEPQPPGGHAPPPAGEHRPPPADPYRPQQSGPYPPPPAGQHEPPAHPRYGPESAGPYEPPPAVP
jgi:hypothetical protein